MSRDSMLSTPPSPVEQPVTERPQNPFVPFEIVEPDYFRTFRVPILRGRGFTASDTRGSESNVALYPAWQRWLREYQPPLLLPWGRNDKFFPEAGARAYLKDVPDAQLHLLDGGHFVLDEYVDTVAGLIRDFIARHPAR